NSRGGSRRSQVADRRDGGHLGGSDVAPPEPVSVDLLGPAAFSRARGLLAGVGAMPVPVAERERPLDLELALEAIATLLPALPVLELVLVQGRRLLDPVRVTELDGQLGRGAANFVP